MQTVNERGQVASSNSTDSPPASAPCARSGALRSSASASFLVRWQLGSPTELVAQSGRELASRVSRPAVERGGARRGEVLDPDHHLWRNGRRWWVAFTAIEEGWRQERVRLSLETTCLDTARRRRDALFAEIARRSGCALSLRFTRGERRRSAGHGRGRS